MKFGDLTAIRFSHTDNRYRSHWICICKCGEKCIRQRSELLKGKVISCGCLNKNSVEIKNKDFDKFVEIWNRLCKNEDTPKIWKDSFLKFKGDLYEIFIDSISNQSLDISTAIENIKGSVKMEDVCGVGYSTEKVKGYKSNKSYNIWVKMIERCYKSSDKTDAYIDCYVSKEWHDYKIFKEWFDKNYYTLQSGERVHLDKDILVKSNRFYSPDNCIFVPQSINQIFQRRVIRADGNPVGVIKSGKNSYIAVTSDNIAKKIIRSEPKKSIEEASICHTIMKRDYILKVAEYYKNNIPKKLYDRLIVLSKTYLDEGVSI